MNKRLQKLRAALTDKNIDGILITQAENRRYLSGFHGTAGYLIVTPGKAIIATDSRYWEQAEKQAPDFKLLKITGNYPEWFPGLISKLGIKDLGFESGDVTYDTYRTLRSVLKKKKVAVKLIAVSNIVETLRMVKEPWEIQLMQKAAEITDAAFESVAGNIKAGTTEKQVAWELEKALHEMGSQGIAFDIIVGSGPNAALPHARPSDRVINDGEPVVIDMGGKYSGYDNDLTRTVCAGKPDAKFVEVYNVVLEAQQAALKEIRAGMTGAEADKIARDIIKKAGYGEAFGHSLGHGVGLAEHENPRLSAASGEKLEDGMVFTVEPGIYITGWGGVRIEDTAVMDKGKAVPLNKAKKAGF